MVAQDPVARPYQHYIWQQYLSAWADADGVVLDYGATYPIASLGRYVNAGVRLPNLLEDALRQGNAA